MVPELLPPAVLKGDIEKSETSFRAAFNTRGGAAPSANSHSCQVGAIPCRIGPEQGGSEFLLVLDKPPNEGRNVAKIAKRSTTSNFESERD